MTAPLRLTTWLAPSLPLALFEDLAVLLERGLGRPVTLDSVTHASGPSLGEDPFADGATDLGFACAPAWEWMRLRVDRAADLLGIAPVFDDPRAAGAPVYFSEVIVRADNGATRLEDLAGGRWAFNDARSLSGCLCLEGRLSPLHLHGEDFFREQLESGSHLRSIELVRSGRADAAAIDSNVLALQSMQDLRVLECWGPHPIQPLFVRRELEAGTRAAVRALLTGPEDTARWAPFTSSYRLAGFAPIDERVYGAPV